MTNLTTKQKKAKERMKTIYTIKLQLDESGTPQVSTSWGKYDDKRVIDRFSDIQLYVIAHNYLQSNNKDETVLKNIFVKFCEEIYKRNKKSEEEA